jgi:hypothetical protein
MHKMVLLAAFARGVRRLAWLTESNSLFLDAGGMIVLMGYCKKLVSRVGYAHASAVISHTVANDRNVVSVIGDVF